MPYKTFEYCVKSALKTFGWESEVTVRMRSDADRPWLTFRCENLDVKAIADLHRSVNPHNDELCDKFRTFTNELKRRVEKQEGEARRNAENKEAEKRAAALQAEIDALNNVIHTNNTIAQIEQERTPRPSEVEEEEEGSPGILGTVAGTVSLVTSLFGGKTPSSRTTRAANRATRAADRAMQPPSARRAKKEKKPVLALDSQLVPD
eukprot:1178822-Prorocentrum_minimum.AAC.3